MKESVVTAAILLRAPDFGASFSKSPRTRAICVTKPPAGFVVIAVDGILMLEPERPLGGTRTTQADACSSDGTARSFG